MKKEPETKQTVKVTEDHDITVTFDDGNEWVCYDIVRDEIAVSSAFTPSLKQLGVVLKEFSKYVK